MRRLIILALVLLPLAPARAEAVTVRDIIELTRAGLGDDVLLALIDVHRTVFAMDTQTITRLKKAGVSERVIEAMIRTGRAPAPPEPLNARPTMVEPPPPEPPVVVIDHQETVREVPVPYAVPVYVPVVPSHDHDRGGDDGPPRDGRADSRPDRDEPRSKPVYWGFGGTLRPDAWKPKP